MVAEMVKNHQENRAGKFLETWSLGQRRVEFGEGRRLSRDASLFSEAVITSMRIDLSTLEFTFNSKRIPGLFWKLATSLKKTKDKSLNSPFSF